MRFEWDEQKNQLNIEQHGLDFADGHHEVRWVGKGELVRIISMRKALNDERRRFEESITN